MHFLIAGNFGHCHAHSKLESIVQYRILWVKEKGWALQKREPVEMPFQVEECGGWLMGYKEQSIGWRSRSGEFILQPQGLTSQQCSLSLKFF